MTTPDLLHHLDEVLEREEPVLRALGGLVGASVLTVTTQSATEQQAVNVTESL